MSQSLVSKAPGNSHNASATEGHSDLHYASGLKYRGDRKDILASAFDQTHKQQVNQRIRNLGSRAVNIKMFDDSGKEMDDAVLNIHGHASYRNKSGYFRLVDESVLEEEMRLADENEEYLNEKVSQARTDTAFATMLGVSVKDLIDICGPCTKIPELAKDMSDYGLLDIRCLPQQIPYYGDGSEAQKKAIAKMKLIISYFRPETIGSGKSKHMDIKNEDKHAKNAREVILGKDDEDEGAGDNA